MKLILTSIVVFFAQIVLGQLPRQHELKANHIYLLIESSTSDRPGILSNETYSYFDTLGRIVKQINYIKNSENDSTFTIYNYINNKLAYQKTINLKMNYTNETTYIDSSNCIVKITTDKNNLTQNVRLVLMNNVYTRYVNDTLRQKFQFKETANKKVSYKTEFLNYMTSHSKIIEYLNEQNLVYLATVKTKRKRTKKSPYKNYPNKETLSIEKKFQYDERNFLIRKTDYHSADKATVTTVYTYIKR